MADDDRLKSHEAEQHTWKEITQAAVPIEEYYENGQLLEGFQIPSMNGTRYSDRRLLMQSVDDFLRNNADNKAIYSPYDADGHILDKEILYDAYDRNVGLSHWNDICEKYGDKMDDVIASMQSRLGPDDFHPSYKGSALGLAAHVYYAQEHGCSEEQIDYMLDRFGESKYGSFSDVEYVRRQFEAGRSLDEVQYLMDNVTDEARQSVDFYMELYGFDKETVGVIGQCKDGGEAYAIYSGLHGNEINLDEARSIIEGVNSIRDYAMIDGNNPHSVVTTESGYQFNMPRIFVHDMERYVNDMVLLRDSYGVPLDKEHLQPFVKDFLENGGQEGNMVAYYEKTASVQLDTVDTYDMVNHIYDAMASAWSGGQTDYHMVSGDTQIDIHAMMIEPSWESFRPAVAIRENGSLLYREDATNVAPYHNELYTQGKFDKVDDVMAYLRDKYDGVKDWREVQSPAPVVFEDTKVKWSNPAYAKEISTPLDRIVFRDMGAYEKNGQRFHKIEFAHACDEKVVGDDKPMSNPYLVNTNMNGKDGKSWKNHAVYLSDSLYKTLMRYTNKDGLENSRWTGVLDARVTYPVSRSGPGKASVNLTRDAEREGKLGKPDVPFDEAKHDAFIKASLQNMRKKREKSVENIANRVSEVSADKQIGE